MVNSSELLISESDIQQFQKQGYLLVKSILHGNEVIQYQEIYDTFLNNKELTDGLRSDLSGLSQANQPERITQIMVPSRQMPNLLTMPMHTRCLQLSQQLLGHDMALDFDMMIEKAPSSNTPTPWHQDTAYWLDMPDKRALSCWLALDETTIDNGCMWYVPCSHTQPTRPHKQVNGKGPLLCECAEEEGVAIEVEPGDCIIHHGNTLHYSRGNITETRRRALITNYRPQAMIDFERQRGYDHTGKRSVKNTRAKS